MVWILIVGAGICVTICIAQGFRVIPPEYGGLDVGGRDGNCEGKGVIRVYSRRK